MRIYNNIYNIIIYNNDIIIIIIYIIYIMRIYVYIIYLLCDCSAQVMCSAASVHLINHCDNKNASASVVGCSYSQFDDHYMTTCNYDPFSTSSYTFYTCVLKLPVYSRV